MWYLIGYLFLGVSFLLGFIAHALLSVGRQGDEQEKALREEERLKALESGCAPGPRSAHGLGLTQFGYRQDDLLLPERD